MIADEIVRVLEIVIGSVPVPDLHSTAVGGQHGGQGPDPHTTDGGGPGPVPHVGIETTDVVHVPDLDLHTRGGERGEDQERGRGRERVAGKGAGHRGEDLSLAVLSVKELLKSQGPRKVPCFKSHE